MWVWCCHVGSGALLSLEARGVAMLCAASSVLSLLISRLRANGEDSLNHTIQRWTCYLNMVIRDSRRYSMNRESGRRQQQCQLGWE